MQTAYTVTYSVGDVAQAAGIDGDAANAYAQSHDAALHAALQDAIVAFLKGAAPPLAAYVPPEEEAPEDAPPV